MLAIGHDVVGAYHLDAGCRNSCPDIEQAIIYVSTSPAAKLGSDRWAFLPFGTWANQRLQTALVHGDGHSELDMPRKSLALITDVNGLTLITEIPLGRCQ
jgi:hypothetical protein